MLLDGGELAQIVIVGLLMFWLSVFSILAIRLITKVKIGKIESIIFKFGVLMGVLSSIIMNFVLLRLDWEPLISSTLLNARERCNTAVNQPFYNKFLWMPSAVPAAWQWSGRSFPELDLDG